MYRFQRKSWILIILAILALGSLGCNRKKDEQSQPSITWTINGLNYKSDLLAKAERKKPAANDDLQVSINGLTSQHSVQIILFPCNTAGTYIAGGNNFNFNAVSFSLGNKTFFADNNNNGESVRVTVTELTNIKIRGDFTGTATGLTGETQTIVGHFDLPFN